MKIINLCPVPIKFFPNSWKELGLALAICSYYISAVISYSFGNEIPLGFELFPIVFGTIIIIHGLCHGSISKSGLLTIGFYCLVLCAMLFSLFYVNHLNNSLIYILRYTYAALFLGFVSVILGSNKQFSPDFFLFWLSIVVSFLVVFAFVTGGTHGGRLTITNSNPIYFSLLCAIVCSISFLKIVEEGKFKDKALYSVFFIICFTGLILSGGRGALVSFGLSLIFYVICQTFLKYVKNNKSKVNSVLVITFGIVGLFSLLLLSNTRSVSGLVNILSGNFGQSGSDRIEAIRFWLEMLFLDPLLGVGVGGIDGYPHNILIELTVYLGVSGFFISLIFTGYILYLSFAAQASSIQSYRALSMMVFCSMSNAMFSFSFNMLSHLFVSTSMLAVLLGREKTKTNSHRSNQ